jgi:crotonobetainyl-CoA:carnitine CoA-transferase CaiB-like acyl-CoA transferase
VPALTGVRVVSLALNVPGPVALARLVTEGASALKVEPPAGDPLATYSRPWYDDLHAAVPRETIDLKSSTGRARLDHHLAQADVLLTSQRPSALSRLGLGVADVSVRFPSLRRVDIVGDTEAPEHAGHDVTYQADAGLLHAGLPTTLLADMTGAERVVAAVLLVLAEPPGARRVVGLRDVVADVAAPRAHGLTAPGGPLGGGLPAYGVYRAADGFVAIAALEPQFRTRLYAALGLPLDAPLHDAMASRSCAEWTALAARHDLPLSVVRPA